MQPNELTISEDTNSDGPQLKSEQQDDCELFTKVRPTNGNRQRWNHHSELISSQQCTQWAD